MGLPFHFLPAANSYTYLKSIDIDTGGLHPLLEGRGQVVTNLGVNGPKKNEIG